MHTHARAHTHTHTHTHTAQVCPVRLVHVHMYMCQIKAAVLDVAENGDGHVYLKDFVRIIRALKPLGGKAEAKDVQSVFDVWDANKDGSIEIRVLMRHLGPKRKAEGG